MRHYSRCCWTCILAGTQLLAGCSSLPKTLPDLTSSTTKLKVADNNPTAGDELPKGETLKACLATAEELATRGHAREAIQLYEKARLIDPQAFDYSRRLAGLYDLADNHAKAVEEFSTAIKAFPKDADLLNNFGCFQDRVGNHVEAERLLRRAAELDPASQRIQVNLGASLARQGKLAESYRTFAAVVGPVAAHHNLGVILAKNGKTDDARQAFQKALEVNPQFEPSRIFLTAMQNQTSS